MTTRIRQRRASAKVDNGFTLIEVMIALGLMTLVLMAAGAFMIRASYTSSAMTSRQGGVDVANQVLEQIRAVDATRDSVTKKSPLVYGRGQFDVFTQWSTSGLSTASTYTGNGGTTFDADTFTTAGTPTVPFQQTIARNHVNYTVDELIGTCVRAVTGTTCGLLTAGDELFRVVVRVTWTPGAGRTCSGSSKCVYVVSTLIDPSVEPTFNVNRKPVANPDTATVAAGSTVDIGVTANDSGDFALAGAVTILSGPANGTYTLSNNIVTYVPTAGFSGSNSFTYTVTDVLARTSNPTTITITVTPVGVNDAATAASAGTITIPVLANDRGTGLTLLSLTTPTSGTAVISANSVKYTVPAATYGTGSFVYTAKDAAGQQYTATVTITLPVKPAAPIAYPFTLCKPPIGYQGNLMSAVTGTNLVPSGLTMTTTGLNGWTVSPISATGIVSITKTSTNDGMLTFSITDPLGQQSNVATITLKGSGPSC